VLTFIAIAWRNVKRNFRRSALTVSIIAFGLGTLNVSNALYEGFHDKMILNAVKIFMGHIQIHAKGFHANPTVEKCFLPFSTSLYSKNPRIKGFSDRIRFQALASTANNSLAVLAVGIDPMREKSVTILEESVVAGSYLSDEKEKKNQCLVGETLSANLRIGIGEKVVLMAQAWDGSLGADAFEIVGICRTGNPEIDRSFLWVPLLSAQEMLSYGERISETVLLLSASSQVLGVQESLKRTIGKSELEILNWKEIAPDIVQIVALDVAMQRVLMLIISIIVVLAIMNTMLMAVQERFMEFGVMLTIGTRPSQVVGMVLAESFFLGLFGVVVGLIVTAIGFTCFRVHGVNLASFSAGVAKLIGLDTTVYPLLRIKQVCISSFFVLASAMLISFVPAIKAARMDPGSALRHI
jgi:ABC-type lipoprotein release transport system permease subunit